MATVDYIDVPNCAHVWELSFFSKIHERDLNIERHGNMPNALNTDVLSFYNVSVCCLKSITYVLIIFKFLRYAKWDTFSKLI
jgi:hypothetical protein